jgi:hypothetical protein
LKDSECGNHRTPTCWQTRWIHGDPGRAWLASEWCLKEFNHAHRLNKRLFGSLIENIQIADVLATLTGT